MNLSATAMRKARLAFLAIFLSTITHPAFTAEMLHMELWEKDGVYHLRSASIINAPPELIISTLLDYNNFYRLSGGIKETRYLDPDSDGVPVALTVVESCVLFFCKQIGVSFNLFRSQSVCANLRMGPRSVRVPAIRATLGFE